MFHAAYRLRMMVIALVATAALLAGCSTTSSTHIAPTATTAQSPTPTKAPTVVYSADWSHGADGWTLPAGWSIQNGALVNDGTGTGSITVPFTMPSGNYEIDFDAREVSASLPQNFGNLFGVMAQDNTGDLLFEAILLFIGNNPCARCWAQWSLRANGGAHTSADYVLSNSMKTYRVQVLGRSVRFFINAPTSVAPVQSQAPLSPASLVIECGHINLVITRFQILAL